MAKVVWTAEAQQWLRRIHDYIARDKPAAAFGVVESLYKRAEILAQFPEITMSLRVRRQAGEQQMQRTRRAQAMEPRR